ncbi:SRPBCC family protein [Streptomyces sp. 3211]|uniref:SRPBCC family protein n=1 Tax=Streptomyces sp. 3211 TaxID=1964449 RepID=UPI001331822A|nr:SRPBCC family protein [Streptomyces sp. 3211]
MKREMNATEKIFIKANSSAVFELVSDVQNLKRWSPECVGILQMKKNAKNEKVFFGFNRRGIFLWFTRCVVIRCESGAYFSFRVDSFGIPISEWGFKVDSGEGGVYLSEHWKDIRVGRSAKFAVFLGLVFTGTTPSRRVEVNRAGMKATLAAIRRAIEG